MGETLGEKVFLYGAGFLMTTGALWALGAGVYWLHKWYTCGVICN